MTELSQPETSIWRERLWFAARLFAAWAVISLLMGIILLPLGQIIYLAQLERSGWTPDGEPLLPLVSLTMRALFQLMCGYFALSFFREHWLKVAIGIPIVGLALLIWRFAWFNFRFYSDASAELFDIQEIINGVLFEFAFYLFIGVGIALRHFLPPKQIPVLIRRLRGRG